MPSSGAIQLTLATLWLLAAGCGSGGTTYGSGSSGSDASATSSSSGGSQVPECERICQRMGTCADWPVDVCAAGCSADVAAHGAAGQQAAGECAACVEASTCTQLESGWGSCANSCPEGANTSSSGGNACAQTFAAGTDALEVRCDPSGSTFYCDCYVNGISTNSFGSSNFCAVDAAARETQSVEGCGWTLDGPQACDKAWDNGGSHYQARCEWSSYSSGRYECTCIADAVPTSRSFVSTNVCSLDQAGATAAVQDGCNFNLTGPDSCEPTWTRGATTYLVYCEFDTMMSAYWCHCHPDGNRGSGYTASFNDPTFCVRDAANQLALVNTGCGWNL